MPDANKPVYLAQECFCGRPHGKHLHECPVDQDKCVVHGGYNCPEGLPLPGSIEALRAERDRLRGALTEVRRIIGPGNSFNIEGLRNICDEALNHGR